MNTKQIGIALASLAIVIAAGCGKKEEIVYSSPDGAVTMSPDGSKMTFKDEKGHEATISTEGNKTTYEDGKGGSVTTGLGQVSEADLGVPFYPGSKENNDSSGKMESGVDKIVTVTRSTTDDPKKVSEFYKGKIKEAQESNANSGGNQINGLMGKLEDGSDFNMTAAKNGTQDTQIIIVVKRKKS